MLQEVFCILGYLTLLHHTPVRDYDPAFWNLCLPLRPAQVRLRKKACTLVRHNMPRCIYSILIFIIANYADGQRAFRNLTGPSDAEEIVGEESRLCLCLSFGLSVEIGECTTLIES